jgi:hypothetical protein
MEELKSKIELIKIELKKAENAKITAEAQKAAAERQLAEVAEQMAAEGVTPETIASEIDKLNAAVVEGIAQIEQQLPKL